MDLQAIFFLLLRASLTKTTVDAKLFADISQEDWKQLYQMSARQGVLGIVYETVLQLPLDSMPPRVLNLQWALGSDAIRNRYKNQYLLSKAIAELWACQGIRVAVLKGMSLSRYYPVPEHRECGDFDCYLFGEFDKGNRIAAENGVKVGTRVYHHGVKVDTSWYKHSHIKFHGLMVENHRYFLPVRGHKERKEIEKILTENINSGHDLGVIPGTSIIIPNLHFTTLFIAYHTLFHFLTEGIRLRHVCDWNCLLAAEQNNIDWEWFYGVCDRYGMRRFVDAMTAISIKYLGLQVVNPAITCTSDYDDIILKSIMEDSAFIYNQGKGRQWSRFKLLSNIVTYRWKYKHIYQRNFFGQMARQVAGYLFEQKIRMN